jgi:hypothetical protein
MREIGKQLIVDIYRSMITNPRKLKELEDAEVAKREERENAIQDGVPADVAQYMDREAQVDNESE